MKAHYLLVILAMLAIGYYAGKKGLLAQFGI